MLTIAAFASLAQLGSGLALTLTIFVEPITLRERRCRDKLEASLKTIPKNNSDGTKTKMNEIWTGLIALDSDAKRAQKLARVPLVLIKFGAALNFLILLVATLVPDAEVTTGWTWILLALSILPVGLGTAWLSCLARIMIKLS